MDKFEIHRVSLLNFIDSVYIEKFPENELFDYLNHMNSITPFVWFYGAKITGSSRPVTQTEKKEEKVYAVYHIECGVMQDISVFKNKEKAEEYYEDLITVNYPNDAEDIISGEQGQEGDHTIDLLTVEIKE